MSPKEILGVRNKIIGLYLEPGAFIEYENMRLYGGAIPCFERAETGTLYGLLIERVHFKYTKDKPPQWDCQSYHERVPQGVQPCFSKVKTFAFNDEKVRWAAELVKRWHHNFPFKPTDNFLRNIDITDVESTRED